MTRPQRPERLTVDVTHDVVVFLIGARINRWWRVWEWLPVVLAMPRMLRELEAKPESGFLGSRGSGVQYWRSIEHLLAYAHDRDGEHFPAWADFNKKVARAASVGIWHETFSVPKENVEAFYFATPAAGLAGIFEAVPARGGRKTARQRLAAAATLDAESRLAS
ncbi:MAG: DUF4188 domain-containing protein [Myxococcales bacterium]|nr:DUF4188 domain-containing protein [Myxococcales bacterium]